jgi:hypothetical protein
LRPDVDQIVEKFALRRGIENELLFAGDQRLRDIAIEQDAGIGHVVHQEADFAKARGQ